MKNRAPSLRQYSDAEWSARVDLAALYRLAAFERWDDLIYTHISARTFPAQQTRF